jgi:hypothetical protein
VLEAACFMRGPNASQGPVGVEVGLDLGCLRSGLKRDLLSDAESHRLELWSVSYSQSLEVAVEPALVVIGSVLDKSRGGPANECTSAAVLPVRPKGRPSVKGAPHRD